MSDAQATLGAYDTRLGPGCNCCGEWTTGVSPHCTMCLHHGCGLPAAERRIEPQCTAWQARNGGGSDE